MVLRVMFPILHLVYLVKIWTIRPYHMEDIYKSFIIIITCLAWSIIDADNKMQ